MLLQSIAQQSPTTQTGTFTVMHASVQAAVAQNDPWTSPDPPPVSIPSFSVQATPVTRSVALHFGTDLPASATITFPRPNEVGRVLVESPLSTAAPMDLGCMSPPTVTCGMPIATVQIIAPAARYDSSGPVECVQLATLSRS